ncbi:hypothetical protein [Lentibacillus cibarius]|nr:hypothetical protein [Lentibacillus cibarius]
MEDMFGSSPNSKPQQPDKKTLDDGNLQAPEGQEAPDLANHHFPATT